MSAVVVDLAELKHRRRIAAQLEPAPPHWESGRDYVWRKLAVAENHLNADDLGKALQSVDAAAREVRRLIKHGLWSEADEIGAAIKTRRRIAAAGKAAETRARNRAASDPPPAA